MKTKKPKNSNSKAMQEDYQSQFLPPKCLVRILLAEDNPGYAKFLKEVFLNANESQLDSIFEVIHKSTLRDAIDYLTNNSIDLVMLDLHLPDSREIGRAHV